jgi:ribonuclease HI
MYPFVVMQWNCSGFRSHIHELRRFLDLCSVNPDVICVQETFLKAKHVHRINGYSILRQDSDHATHYGLAILLKEGISHTLLQLEEVPGMERQGIEVSTDNGKLKIINVYISPSSSVTKDQLSMLFSDRRCIVVGDYNAHSRVWKSGKTDRRGADLEEVVMEKDLVVLNTGQPTLNPRVGSVKDSVIDLSIATKDVALRCTHSVLNTSLGSNHKVAITRVDEVADVEENAGLHRWNLKKADWKVFREVSKHRIHDGIISDDFDASFQVFLEEMHETASSAIPERKVTSRGVKRHKPLLFWNDNCTQAIYTRNRLRNKAARSKNLDDQINFKEQQDRSRKIISDTAKQRWEDFCSTLDSQSKLGPVWGMARRMNGAAAQRSIPTLTSEGREAVTNIDKANLLAETYAKTSSTDNYSDAFRRYVDASVGCSVLDPPPTTVTTDADVESLNDSFSLRELKEAIRGAKKNRSPGEDKIPYEMIQNLHRSSLKVLLKIYNGVWRNGSLPGDWKHAIILPIPKPSKDATKPESYRPISLTSCLCKIMERMVTNRLQWFVESKELLTKDQAGFRKNRSTIDQIIRLQDKINKSLKSQHHVIGIFIDFEKAYDMLHVPTLMRKVRDLGVVGNMYAWIQDFLTDRTFQVKVGAELSVRCLQKNGTPQGSVISPLLFLIMINDIPRDEGTEMSLFADDSALFTAGANLKLLQKRAQRSLDLVYRWCEENGFKISTAKTTAVVFSNNRQGVGDVVLKVNNQKIEVSTTAKFLGVIFDCRLTWNAHIDYVVTKCRKRLGLLRSVSGNRWGAGKKSLLMLYRALIRPVLDYGAVAFCTASDTQRKKMETIQAQALRICCGAAHGTATTAVQNECGEMPLHLRWLGESLKAGVKIITTKDHVAEDAMKDHWTIHYDRYPVGKEPLYTRTKDFFDSCFQECKGPVLQKSPPWRNGNIEVDLSLTRTIDKRTMSPEIQKMYALELIDRYRHHTCIYTDGSRYEDTSAAAVVIPDIGYRRILRLADSSSVYATELTAIRDAIDWISEHRTQQMDTFAIFTDSLSAAESVKVQTSDSRPTLMMEVIDSINKLGRTNVNLVWIPSHVGIRGNEEADAAAKEGLNLPTVNSTSYIERNEMFAKIKLYVNNRWQKEYTDDPKGAFYKNIEPLVSTRIKYTDAPRKLEVQITRLRLGKVLLNQWLHQMDLHPDGNCDECNVPDTIDHLLLECCRKNISQTIHDKCQELGIPCTTINILKISGLQKEVVRLISEFNHGKIL